MYQHERTWQTLDRKTWEYMKLLTDIVRTPETKKILKFSINSTLLSISRKNVMLMLHYWRFYEMLRGLDISQYHGHGCWVTPLISFGSFYYCLFEIHDFTGYARKMTTVSALTLTLTLPPFISCINVTKTSFNAALMYTFSPIMLHLYIQLLL